MEQKKLLINPNADVAGIRPEDVQQGDNFRVTKDIGTPVVTVQERIARAGGNFTQYTINLTNHVGDAKQLRFLFEKHLAPLAKAWGEDPEQWRDHIVWVKGIEVARAGGRYWDVELKPVQ